MYTALKFARAHREQRLNRTRRLEKEKLERKLNKLKAKLEKESRVHQQQLTKISNSVSVADISIPIPDQQHQQRHHQQHQGPSTSSSAINFSGCPHHPQHDSQQQYSGNTTIRIKYTREDSDSTDDEDEFRHVRLASSSRSAAAHAHNLHFLSVSPVAGGSVASSCSNLSQVNISSPVFNARRVSASASLQGRDRNRDRLYPHRGSLTYSDYGGALDLNGRWKEQEQETAGISTISGSHVQDGTQAGAAAGGWRPEKKNSICSGFLKKPTLDPNQTRMTSNMIASFIILTGLLAAILGFLATEDFSYISPAIMAIGFIMIVVGFIIIFLGEVAILCFSNVLNKLLALIGKNKHGVIAPKLETCAKEDAANDEDADGTEETAAAETDIDTELKNQAIPETHSKSISQPVAEPWP